MFINALNPAFTIPHSFPTSQSDGNFTRRCFPSASLWMWLVGISFGSAVGTLNPVLAGLSAVENTRPSARGFSGKWRPGHCFCGDDARGVRSTRVRRFPVLRGSGSLSACHFPFRLDASLWPGVTDHLSVRQWLTVWNWVMQQSALTRLFSTLLMLVYGLF